MFSDFLADHFSLYTVILSPLHYVFGSITLLLVQIAAILLGAFGVYKIVKLNYTNEHIPLLAMIHFLLFFGIYSALGFDYHDNVVSAMLVPWFIYFLIINNLKVSFLMVLLVCIGKENMPIWVIFISLGLLITYFKDSKKRIFLISTICFCLVYLVVIFKLVMPGLDPMMAKNGYNSFKYSILGNNFKSMMDLVFHDFGKLFKAFFIGHLPSRAGEGIKEELYFCLVLSGGVALLLRPAYLIMIIPILAQKVLSDDVGKWGINYHYSIEFAPILTLALFDVLKKIRNLKIQYSFSVLAIAASLYVNISKSNYRTSIYFDPVNTNIFSKKHYYAEFDYGQFSWVSTHIPKNANLSALNIFCPHLSFRDKIYQFPDVHDAEYVLLAKTKNAYPLAGNALTLEINSFLNSPDWELVIIAKDIYLFRQRKH